MKPMKILFLSLSGLIFDVSTPEREPLGGTESSFCYLARALARIGHDVTLSARNVSTTEILGVKHTPEVVLADYDILITNAPIQIAPGKKKPYYILWNHLAHFDEALRALTWPDVRLGIDCIVSVSDWQNKKTEIQFGKFKRSVVIGNGLTPAFENMFKSPQELLSKKYDLAAYTSTPFRGLHLMPSVWSQIRSPTKLAVYSSMKVYQTPDAYESIYSELKQTKQVDYIGSVNQTNLATGLKYASYWPYLNIFPETFCIAALEALAAGCHILTTDRGALKSTCGAFADYLRTTDETTYDNLIKDFAWAFDMAYDYRNNNPNEWAQMRYSGVCYANQFTWANRAKEWEALFASI